MTDDEQKNDVVEETKDEGSEESAAGPVEETGSSSSQAAGDDPISTPPAEDAAETDEGSSAEEAPAEEPEAAEAEPAAEEEEAPVEEEAPAVEEAPADEAPAETSAEDELPWKEKRRLERSRRPHQAKPQLSPDDRAAQRREERKARAGVRSKGREAAKAKRSASGPGTPPVERTPNAAKVRQGIVVSDKGDKSITVRIDIARRHPTYEKVVRRSRTLHAHDEGNEAGEGDVVRVIETRPLSKTKRWRLVEVVERAR